MPRTVQKFSTLKFSDLKRKEFRGVFGAEEDARLSPCYDEKPKNAEITLFQAGLNSSTLLNVSRAIASSSLVGIT